MEPEKNLDDRVERAGRLRLFLRLWGWMAAFPLLFAVIFGLITMVEGRKAERLEADGAVAEATVTGKRIDVSYDSDGDKDTDYMLEFRFRAEGRELADEEEVSRSFYHANGVGDSLPVRYWRPDPSVFELEPGATATTILWTKIVSIVGLVIAGFWTERCWRKANRMIRLHEHGARRRATVLRVERTNVRVNNRPRYRLAWEDDEGFRGRSLMGPFERFDDWPEGGEITVYADPAGRLPPVWEEDLRARR
jgi:hypothetical protein